MKEATILHLQKYSIHDGQGIRTTVFFKGCPLACLWCHNPESQSFEKEQLFYAERCTQCQACVSSCPQKAIDDKTFHANMGKCTLCGLCLDICPKSAREIAGKNFSVKNLVKELLKDRLFYEESGGGVTLSGGEVLCQRIDFIEDLAKKLHRQGISVNIDTCGQAPYEHFQRLLPYVDTFLYDIKNIDTEKHKEYTGIGNELILENLKKLTEEGAKVALRLPLIEGLNTDKQAIENTVDFLQKHTRPCALHLLPYHRIGSHKYAQLGRESHLEKLCEPSKKTLNIIQEYFINKGFTQTHIGG